MSSTDLRAPILKKLTNYFLKGDIANERFFEFMSLAFPWISLGFLLVVFFVRSKT